MRRRIRGLLLVASTVTAVATVLVPATASGASTRAEYIAQADPICAKANKLGEKQLKGFGKDVLAERWGRAIRRFRVALRVFNREIASLAELEPPIADAALLEEWLAELRRQSPLARRVIRALKQQSVKLVARRSGRLVKASRSTKRLVEDYGFRSCDDS